MRQFFILLLSYVILMSGSLVKAQPSETLQSETLQSETVLASAESPTVALLADNETEKVLSYRTQGSGPAVYLLADGPGMSSHYLDEVGEAFAGKGFTAVVPESRHASYFGTLSEGDITLDSYVEDIESLRSSRGDKEIILFGHKWGAILAMAYLTKYGGNVKKVVLSGPAGAHLGYFQSYGQRLVQKVSPYEQNLVEKLRDSIDNGGDRQVLSREILRVTSIAMLHNKEKHSQDLEDRFISKTDFNEDVYSTMIKHMRSSGYDLRDDLNRFYRPVLVVQGEFDLSGQHHAMGLSDDFPDGSFKMIQESAAYPWIENSQEYYNAIFNFVN
ncbi:MAG: alpha/beta hydrolase [Cyclobacteriaceae bacterium]